MASIALVTIALNNMAGGLERNIVALANKFVRDGHTVRLVTFDWATAEAFYDIDERVAWFRLGTTEPHSPISRVERGKLIRRMRDAFTTSPAVTHIVCFHHGLMSRCLAARGLRSAKIICSERNALSIYDHISTPKWNRNFLALAAASRITVQFKGYRKDYPLWLRNRIVEVPNPIYSEPVVAEQHLNRERVILSVGRLNAQKQFQLLIEAFDALRARDPSWKLRIIGDGPLRNALDQQIKALGLQSCVTISQPTTNVAALYTNARLYCQPSLWEGFPNALAEAMAAGMVPVGFTKTRGVVDLVESALGEAAHDVLAPGGFNSANLAETLIRVADAEASWPSWAHRARRVRELFSTQRWSSAWDHVIDAA